MRGEDGKGGAVLHRGRNTKDRKMRAVRAVDDQTRARRAADGGERRNILPHAVISGADENESRRIRHTAESCGERFRLDAPGEAEPRHLGIDKLGRQVEKHSGSLHAFVARAVAEEAAAGRAGECERGKNALRRAAGQEKRLRRAIGGGEETLRIGDGADALVKIPCRGELGKVDFGKREK